MAKKKNKYAEQYRESYNASFALTKRNLKQDRKEAKLKHVSNRKSSVAGSYTQERHNWQNAANPVRSNRKVTRDSANHKSMSRTSKSTQKEIRKSVYGTKAGRAYAGFVNSAMLLGAGKVPDSVSKTASYKAGSIAGDLASYGAAYKAAGKATAKLGAKLAATKAGEKATAKIAGSTAAENAAKLALRKAGKEATKEAVEKQAKTAAQKVVATAAKDVAADATVGTAMNAARETASGNGVVKKDKSGKVKPNKDFAKAMAANAAMDLGVGAVSDFAAPALKALKATKADSKTVARIGANGKVKYVKDSKLAEKAANRNLDTNIKRVSGKRKLSEYKAVQADEKAQRQNILKSMQNPNADAIKAYNKGTKADSVQKDMVFARAGALKADKLPRIKKAKQPNTFKANIPDIKDSLNKIKPTHTKKEIHDYVRGKLYDQIKSESVPKDDVKEIKELIRKGKYKEAEERLNKDYYIEHTFDEETDGAKKIARLYAGGNNVIELPKSRTRTGKGINNEIIRHNFGKLRMREEGKPRKRGEVVNSVDDVYNLINDESGNYFKMYDNEAYANEYNTVPEDVELERIINLMNTPSYKYTHIDLPDESIKYNHDETMKYLRGYANVTKPKEKLKKLRSKYADYNIGTKKIGKLSDADRKKFDRFKRVDAESADRIFKEAENVHEHGGSMEKLIALLDGIDEKNPNKDRLRKLLRDVEDDYNSVPNFMGEDVPLDTSGLRKAIDDTNFTHYAKVKRGKESPSVPTIRTGKTVSAITSKKAAISEAINNPDEVNAIRDYLERNNTSIKEIAEQNGVKNSDVVEKLHGMYKNDSLKDAPMLNKASNNADFADMRVNVENSALERGNTANDVSINVASKEPPTGISAAKLGTLTNGETSKAAETIKNMPAIKNDTKAQEYIKASEEIGSLSKSTQHRETAVANALDAIDKQGADVVAAELHGQVTAGKGISQDNIAKCEALIKYYTANGDYDKMDGIVEDAVAIASDAGRALQAMNLFKATTPQGRVACVMRGVEQIKKQNDVDITVPDELIERLKTTNDAAELQKVKNEISNAVWNQVPPNFVDRLNAWRYLSMLGNPKTHIRNIIGNTIFYPVKGIRNVIATGLEKAILKEGGSKAILIPSKDKGIINLGKKYWDLDKESLRSIGKWEDGAQVDMNIGYRPYDAKTFESRPFEFLSKLNSAALDVEDILFMKPAYYRSFAQYLKANGATAETATEELIRKARQYASDEALNSTYRDFSVLSSFITKAKRDARTPMKNMKTPYDDIDPYEARKNKLIRKAKGLAIESMVPFAKTPINIARRGFDYSPVGLAKGFIRMAAAKGDTDKLIKAISDISSGITGTGILALGYFAGSKGFAQGSIDSTGKTKDFEKSLGKQAYSIKIGDYTYTMDWAAPICMPFFTGVEIGSSIQNGNLTDALTSINKFTDPIINLSMLSGLNNAFNNNFDNKNILVRGAQNVTQNYVSQFFPTLGSQIAKTMTDATKDTTSTAENQTIRNNQRWINSLRNKTPFTIGMNADKVDVWGNKEVKNTGDPSETAANYAKAALLNFVSPGTLKKDNTSAVDRNLKKLIADGAETKVLPNTGEIKTKYTINKEDINITPKELSSMKETYGKYAKSQLSKLFKSNEYKKMSVDEKQKAITDIYTDASAQAKREMLSKRGYSSVDIAWQYDLNKSQREAMGSKKMFKQKMKLAGINADQYIKYSGKGVSMSDMLALKTRKLDIGDYAEHNEGLTVSQYAKAKEYGIPVKKYAKIKSQMKSGSYVGKAAALMQAGLVKNSTDMYNKFSVYKSNYEKAARLLNAGYSPKEISEVEGSQVKTTEMMKTYGVEMHGSSAWRTQEGTYKYINSQPISRKKKALMWEVYKYSSWGNDNPFK